MKKTIICLSVLFLSVSFIGKKCDQNDTCKDVLKNSDYLRKDSLWGKINNKDYVVYEIMHNENETDRFLLLSINNKFTCNHNSLLNTNDYQGYSTNYIRKEKDGFSFSIEYGSRYYYNYEFYFKFENNKFYLKKMSETTFDKANPKESGSKNKKMKMIKSKISFEKFNIHNYISE